MLEMAWAESCGGVQSAIEFDRSKVVFRTISHEKLGNLATLTKKLIY